MKKLRYKVLFLASWYPNKVHPLLGIFVKRKAKAMAQLCDIAVIHVTDDPFLETPYHISFSIEENIPTAIVYFKPASHPLLKGLVYNFRYFKSYFLGWKTVKTNWGLPDLLHVNVVDRAGYFAFIMKWLRGFQYVITEHSTPDIDFLRGLKQKTHISLKYFKSLVIRNSSALNVDSQQSLQYLQKTGFKGNFSVIPNVVEINEEIVSLPKKSTGIKIIAHISNLIDRKNVYDIIRVCSKIYTARQDFELHIVGEGSNRKKLEQLANELHTLNTCIFFHGVIDEKEKQRLLQSAHVHVLNSDEEGFSVVTAESICYGTPVIATRCGGPEDFVTSKTGILIERRNNEELEKAIVFMLDHSQTYSPSKLAEYGKNRFSEFSVAEQTYTMYQQSITKWSAGNTSFPVSILPNWKLLDVGSGHQPNHRANVLLERYLEPTIHRTNQNVPAPKDKYMVVGDGLCMPFPDKAFDFVIASHIAEHVDDPVQFCKELQRVAKQGYIETPGPLTEWLMPTASHKWIITKNRTTVRFKKNSYKTTASMSFFRFFYLNRDGYVPNTLKTDNIFLITLNVLLLKFWGFVPYAYMKLHWKEKFSCTVDT
ncbi:MAG: glycosyltransferase [Bacteroidota bacterium]